MTVEIAENVGMDVVGYADRMAVPSGSRIKFMVSCLTSAYQADLVQLIHSDPHPSGPGLKILEVPSSLAGTYPGQEQKLRNGSFGVASFAEPIGIVEGLSISAWFYPTKEHATPQTVLSLDFDNDSWVCIETVQGQVRVRSGDGVGNEDTSVGLDVAVHRWYRLALAYDSDWQGQLALYSPGFDEIRRSTPLHPFDSAANAVTRLTVAARYGADGNASGFFNGKLEAPTIYNRSLQLSEPAEFVGRPPADPALAWDFSLEIPTDRAVDVSGHERHGRLLQRPTRGATGHNWSGTETAWRHATDQYGAAHFHEDDLTDARWTVGLEWDVPDDLPSAVYALRLRAGDQEDHIPFVVTPGRERDHQRIALLLPTFSYLAYANEQTMNDPSLFADLLGEGEMPSYPVTAEDQYMVSNSLLSLYDTHSDGSGVCYSSALRPIVNMRPGYHTPWMNSGRGAAHGINADLALVDWLRARDIEVDVITDHELDRDGVQAVAPYEVVLTGSHPEYASRRMVDSLQEYVAAGGRLMYLGGNGMYWVAELDNVGSTLEIRRRGPSTRAWEPAGGEAFLSVNGELGGLWRYRGRTPQTWLGVGFTAQGLGPGRPYVRTPDSHRADLGFIFDGLESHESIGDFECLLNGYGAAGYEIDRADADLGTPAASVVVASATGFSDSYQAVSEEIGEADSAQGGTVSPKVRSDMVITGYRSGGAVFSVGSIAWASCLSYNGYDNSVSTVTENVLKRFLDPAPLNTGGSDSAIS